jgi:hemerythrin-like domain-containing protein
VFSRLRARTTSCHAELDELERQHARDVSWLAALSQRVDDLAGLSADALSAALATLHDEVSRYADFLWDHLGREEGVILPAAQRHLQSEDWKAIDAAFAHERDHDAEHGEPLRALFSRIVDPATA